MHSHALSTAQPSAAPLAAPAASSAAALCMSLSALTASSSSSSSSSSSLPPSAAYVAAADARLKYLLDEAATTFAHSAPFITPFVGLNGGYQRGSPSLRSLLRADDLFYVLTVPALIAEHAIAWLTEVVEWMKARGKDSLSATQTSTAFSIQVLAPVYTVDCRDHRAAAETVGSESAAVYADPTLISLMAFEEIDETVKELLQKASERQARGSGNGSTNLGQSGKLNPSTEGATSAKEKKKKKSPRPK